MLDVGGADEEEFEDEHPFGNSEGLKGTQKLLLVEYVLHVFFLIALLCWTLEVQMKKSSQMSICLEILQAVKGTKIR